MTGGYVQADMLQLTTSGHCELCGRRLRTQHSRDRGVGPKCWSKTHTEPSRTTRGGAWWRPQTGPNLIDEKGSSDVAIRTEISQYTISATTPGRDQYTYLWDVTVDRSVQMDGSVRWAVRNGGYVLGRDGDWEWEPIPSDRTKEWLAAHRFARLETALRLAETAAPEVEINGKRARDL